MNREIEAKKIKELKSAWKDFKKYGQHKGKCNFDAECPKCKRPTGVSEKNKKVV